MSNMSSLVEMMNLEGRAALITGGGGHIGGALGQALAELGAAVALLDKSADAAEAHAATLAQAYGIKTLALACDLAREEDIKAAAVRTLAELGRLDILVNCAGFVGDSKLAGWVVPFAEQSVQSWRAALEVNLTAPFVLTQACAQALKDSSHGSIINVGSIYGVLGPDMRLYQGTSMGNPAAYGASKGGLVQLSRYLATVLAPRVRVNCISLGGVRRSQPREFIKRYEGRTPLGRMATEDDFKGAVAFLASDLSSYVTGHNLIIDGGFSKW